MSKARVSSSAKASEASLEDLPGSVRLGYRIIGHKPSRSHKEKINSIRDRALSDIKEYSHKSIRVKSRDGSELETIVVNPKRPLRPQIYVIRFNGNEESAGGNIDEISQDVAAGCTAICFNYPGVGDSSGSPKNSQSLVESGKAQVQYLLDRGVRPEQIILKGHSLGGAVATKVASELHRDGKNVNLFNSRSFSSLSYVVAGWGGKFILPIAKKILNKYGWELNVVSDWKSIPPESKELLYTKNDAVIKNTGSLHTRLEEDKQALEARGESASYRAERPYIEIIPDAGKNYGNNHVTPLDFMRDKRDSSKTGDKIFHHFVSHVKTKYQSLHSAQAEKEARAAVETDKKPAESSIDPIIVARGLMETLSRSGKHFSSPSSVSSVSKARGR